MYACSIVCDFSSCTYIGYPPIFLSQPEDITAESLYKTYRGIKAQIIITCNVTGSPTPSITWYRRDREIIGNGNTSVMLRAPDEEVISLVGLVYNTSLYLNMTMQVTIRETELFHCLATNMLGETVTAAARSRDVSVTFAGEFIVQCIIIGYIDYRLSISLLLLIMIIA